MASPLVVIDDALFLEHRAPEPHPERPERLLAARRALAGASLAEPPALKRARDASDDELVAVHTERHVRELGQSAGSSGYWDADTYFGPFSAAAARRAAGAGAELTETLLAGTRFGVALVRPPGHHARPDAAMGFCLFNNIAVAAAKARAAGVERVMIVDFDVHHGNGTQEIFYRDPSVLFLSLHQYPFYPGTGAAHEQGAADGEGFTVNIPLDAGAGDAVYAAAFERIVAPVAEQYAPGLVLVSAGFDAHERDPLAQMHLTENGYATMIARLLQVTPDVPVGLVLEGGYDLEGIERSLRRTIETLLGQGPAEVGREISQRHESALSRASAAAARYWKLP